MEPWANHIKSKLPSLRETSQDEIDETRDFLEPETYTVYAKYEFGELMNLGTFDPYEEARKRKDKAYAPPESFDEVHINTNRGGK